MNRRYFRSVGNLSVTRQQPMNSTIENATDGTCTLTSEKVAARKLKIQKLHEEKHATAIQSQWRGKMIRKQIVENANNEANDGNDDADDDELEASAAAPEAAKDRNVEQIREQAAIRTDVELLKTNREIVSSWPTTLVENFETPVEGISWPELGGDSTACWKWLVENNKIITRCVTWNLCGNQPPSKEEIRRVLIPLNKFHMLVIGSEECERSIQASMLNPSKKNWEALLVDVMGEKYAPIRSHTLQAIHIMVFVHVSLIPFVSGVSSAAVTTGIANTLGNKGGAGMKLSIGATSLVFANAHLAAHQNAVKARNADFQRIDSEMPGMLTTAAVEVVAAGSASNSSAADAKLIATPSLTDHVTAVDNKSSVAGDSDNKACTTDATALVVVADAKASAAAPLPSVEDAKPTLSVGTQEITLPSARIGHNLAASADAVVFMGDLNYRIRGNRTIVDQLLMQGMHEVLYNNDQLRWSMEHSMVLNGFTEPPLHFKPTYKFDVKSDIYDTGLKRRIPAWTDRILYAQKPSVQCIAYDADFTLKTSDHRPVYASFVIDINFTPEHKKLFDILIQKAAIADGSVDRNVDGVAASANGDAATVLLSTEAKMDYNSTIEFSSQSQVCTIS